MKNLSAAALLTLLFLPGMATGAQTEPARTSRPIVATVTLPHATVLPGVPFDIVVTLKNVSNRPATAGLIANLVVTLPDGETVALNKGENDHWRLEPHDSSRDSSVQLAPGESVERVASWDRGSVPNWSRYDSFSGPGTYGIALDLARGFRDHEYNDHVNYVGVLRTSSARLERVVPVGEDEALWKRMQEVTGGHWSDNHFMARKTGVALAEEIVQLHPTSGYYPYALLLHRIYKQKDDIAPLLEAAKRFGDSPAFPYLLKAAGDAALYEAMHADQWARDPLTAKKFYELAETYYREALATKSLAIRGDAELRLHDVAVGLERVAKPKAQ